jgi:hypothetical protein
MVHYFLACDVSEYCFHLTFPIHLVVVFAPGEAIALTLGVAQVASIPIHHNYDDLVLVYAIDPVMLYHFACYCLGDLVSNTGLCYYALGHNRYMCPCMGSHLCPEVHILLVVQQYAPHTAWFSR